ncbi:hypothetical protein GmHk_15G043129 [Glycine max]|nr:hypothetical protein GmHk_15G043129 [Glycine max]
MLKLKSCFWMRLTLVFLLLLSSCKSRPLGTPTTLKSFPAQDSSYGAHASYWSWVLEFQESPRKPGRLTPEDSYLDVFASDRETNIKEKQRWIDNNEMETCRGSAFAVVHQGVVVVSFLLTNLAFMLGLYSVGLVEPISIFSYKEMEQEIRSSSTSVSDSIGVGAFRL